MKKILLLVALIFGLIVTGCASIPPPPVHVYDYPNSIAKKVVIEGRVDFYHETALNVVAGDWEVKGEPDPAFAELGVFLMGEVKKQLAEAGYVIVDVPDKDTISLRIYGVQKSIGYIFFVNELMAAAIVEGRVEGKLLFSYNRATVYNTIAAYPEKQIRKYLVPRIVKALDEVYAAKR